jgi:hypothetical protein
MTWFGKLVHIKCTANLHTYIHACMHTCISEPPKIFLIFKKLWTETEKISESYRKNFKLLSMSYPLMYTRNTQTIAYTHLFGLCLCYMKCMYSHMYTHIHAVKCIYSQMYTHTHYDMHIFTCVRTHTRTMTCIYSHVYTHTHTHYDMHIFTCVHTHTHTHLSLFV